VGAGQRAGGQGCCRRQCLPAAPWGCLLHASCLRWIVRWAM